MLKSIVATFLKAVLVLPTEAFHLPSSSPFVSSFSLSRSGFASVDPTRTIAGNRQHLQRSNLIMSAQVSSLSWESLKSASSEQTVGTALNQEMELRKTGKGSAHVQSRLRLFDSQEKPKITLYRDHAGWCPYCQVRSLTYSIFYISLLLRIFEAKGIT